MLTQRTAGIAIVCLILAASAAMAQINTATIVGSVVDGSGATISSAAVKVVNVGTQDTHETTTDSTGSYIFDRLPVGDYTLSVRAPGFKQFERKDVRIDATQRVKIDVVMEVGVLTESVTVTGGAPLVSTQNTELGVVIGEEQVRNLPLNGRNFSQLIALEPGAVVSGGAVYFNGLSRDGMNISVDGTDAANPDRPSTSDFGGQTQQNILSVEFIEEFKTSKGVFSAELGRASSGGVNVITKSGTNFFHGSVFEFLRNDKLDARNFFAAQKDELRLNQFGATAGGPVVRNRAFFFVGWEGVREIRGRQITGEVPNDSLRQRMLAANPAYAAILNLMPPANEPRADPDRGFHRRSDAKSNREDTGLARLDFNVSAKDRIFLRYTILDAYSVVPGLSPINGTEYPTQTRTGTFSWNRTLTPASVNEFRAGVNKQDIPRATQAFVPQQIGSLSGFLSTPGQELLHANGGSWTVLDNFNYNRGRHSLRAGLELRRFHYGRANYENPVYTIDTLADLLASRFTSARVTLGNDLRRLRESDWGFYVQDDFRASSRLTVNLGLRYEYFSPVTERDGLLFNIVSDPFGPFRKQGEPIWANDLNNFGPRFGMAWDVQGNSKNVIRAGAGVFYSPNTYREVTALVNPPDKPYTLQISNRDFPTLRYPINVASLDLKGFPGLATRNLFDPLQRTTYSIQWSLDYQREITRDLVATVGYVGNHGVKALTLHWLNEVNFATGTRPNSTTGRVSYQEHSGMSNYNGMQLSLKKRFAQTYMFNLHYTYAKALELGGIDNMTASGVSNVQDHRNIRQSRDRQIVDIRHNLSLDHSWDIPFERWFSAQSRAMRGIVGGWQLFGILSLRSGTPFVVQSGRDNYGLGSSAAQRPDLVLGVPVYLDGYRESNTHQYINRQAFADPCDVRRLGRPCGIFGNLGGFLLDNPGAVFYDLSIFKNVKLGEHRAVQFRTELFNIFNHTNFSGPGSTLTSATFGQITAAGRSRELQFALKLVF
jgi:Carboxypeptidase regulatory-like domain/TonB dependent receptor